MVYFFGRFNQRNKIRLASFIDVWITSLTLKKSYDVKIQYILNTIV